MKTFALFCLALAAVPFEGSASTLTLNAVNSGWWANYSPGFGYHATGGGQNYYAGFQAGLNYRYNDYFVFDLTGVTGITAATLSVYNPSTGYDSPNSSETYSLFEVSTAISSVEAFDNGSTSGFAIYQDLGSGVQYGTDIVSAADQNSQVQVILDGQAIANLNAANGLFALGGSLVSAPTSGSNNVAVFSGSTFGNSAGQPRQLILTIGDTTPSTPEPGTLSITFGGLGLLWARRKTLARR